MKRLYERQLQETPTFQDLIGLGSGSTRKTHYALLEAKLAELEVERNRYKWLFENAIHGIFQAGFNGEIHAANPAFAYICGYDDTQQMLYQPGLLEKLLVKTDDFAQLKNNLERDKVVQLYETTFKRQDGKVIHISINALMKDEHGQNIFEAFVQDISDYKQAEDELTRLNVGLEARVIQRTQELTELNKKLVQEITDRKLVQDELVLAKESAENANLSKDKYLATASHDLLQPMNAARLLVSALRERKLAEEDNYLVERVHLALEGAEDLLNDLLYISRLDQNSVQPNLDVFDIQQLLAILEGEFLPVAKSSELDLRARPSHYSVCTDAHLLGRILRNFISNALRYTRKGKVLIGCRRKGENLSIQVWDTGMGIPKNRLQEIFNEFHQLNAHQQDGRKGVGLGLAIVDRLARMLDHPIEVRSRLEHGSMFSILVPLAPSAAPPQPKSTSLSPLNGLEGASILVMDNDNSILISMKILLNQWGCVVYLARDQFEAIELCKAESLKPDVILADYQLEDGQTGTDAVLAMRKCAKTRIPAAIITADHSDESNQLFKKLDMPMLNKPVKPAKLRALLSHLLQEKNTKDPV